MRKDLSGRRFGMLVVLAQAPSKKGARARWLCRCDCGQEKNVCGSNLGRSSRSCGCQMKEIRKVANTKHGKSRTKIYWCWYSMLARCLNVKSPDYRNYGGRGITICERWRSFDNFLADMGEPPTPHHSIDRIDVNGNYEPGNCRWATTIEQSNNRRTNVRYEFRGKLLSLARILEITKSPVSYHRAHQRITRHGWSLERAIEARPSRTSHQYSDSRAR